MIHTTLACAKEFQIFFGIELGTFTYKKKPILLKSSLSFGI
jgi:hypothetical protein